MNSKSHRWLRATASALIGAVAITGCGTRASSSQTSGDLKTDFGVTDRTITLGVMSDFSNVGGPLAKTVYAGNRIWANEVNKAGGICGRQIKLEAQDHKFDTQLANTQYASMKGEVLGLVNLLGSPVIASLLPQLTADHMPTMAGGWSSDLLGHPELAVLGTTYDLDAMNGLQFLIDQGIVIKGDSIGHIYNAGDYGENAAAGAKYAARELGVKWVGEKVDATTTDISAQMAAFKAADVKAILISSYANVTAMVASQAPSLGLDGPLVVNAPGYDPAILKSPAGPVLRERLYVVSSQAPFTGDGHVQQMLATAFPEVAKGVTPTANATGGYAQGKVMGAALEGACKSGDLTRKSVVDHLRTLTNVETGVYPPLTLKDPSKATSTESLILKPADNPGGLTVVKDYFASPLAEKYVN
jgi:ABC-type branched-subunit amino acid transport system substrate-binding protein